MFRQLRLLGEFSIRVHETLAPPFGWFGREWPASLPDLTGHQDFVLRRFAQHDRRLNVRELGNVGPDFSHAWMFARSFQRLW